MSRYRNGKIFSLQARKLQHDIPRWECHAHTSYTDGSASVEEIVKRAVEKGLNRVIFTEHTDYRGIKKSDWYSLYTKAIQSARIMYGDKIEILMGIEVPATDFKYGLDITDLMLETADFILGAAHRYPGLEERRIQNLNRDEFIDLEYQTLMALAENPYIDAIAHIGGTCRKYCCEMPVNMIRQVIKKANKYNIAIEINNKYHQPLGKYMDLCIQEDAFVTLGSDVHNVCEVGIIVDNMKAVNQEIYL